MVNIKKGRIERCVRIENAGMNMRINRDNKIGFAGYSLDTADAESLIKSASVPKDCVNPADPMCLDFPTIKPGTVDGIYDKTLSSLALEDMEDAVYMLAEGAARDSIVAVDGYIHTLSRKWIVGNSQGECATIKDTFVKVLVRTRGRLLFKRSMNVEFQDSRAFGQIGFEALGESCAEKTVKALKSTKMTEAKIPVVLSPAVVSNMFYNFANSILNAENIYRRISCLRKDRLLGAITLIDDGTIPGGVKSSPMDEEGVKKERKVLIEEGRVVTYLHNLVSSKKFNVQPTGNACRLGYIEKPTIGPSNLILSPGDQSSREIIENIRRGIYINLTFDIPNITNGDYFLTGQNSFWIENGEIGEAVLFPALDTNIFQIASSIEEMSEDVSVLNGVWSPTIKLSAVKVIPSPVIYAGASLW